MWLFCKEKYSVIIMCVHPVYRPNLHHARHQLPGAHSSSTDVLSGLRYDTEHTYVPLPCGHCPECISLRQMYMVQRLETEAKYNHFFFSTLTYDNKHLPVLSGDALSYVLDLADHPAVTREEAVYRLACRLFAAGLPGPKPSSVMPSTLGRSRSAIMSQIVRSCHPATSGEKVSFARSAAPVEVFDPYLECLDEGVVLSEDVTPVDSRPVSESSLDELSIPFADVHDVQLMVKRMRDNNTLGRSFRYVAVTERGGERGRPHVHILWLVPKEDDDTVATCETLNAKLRKMLLEYWSTNIGTRKNPVYERNFTYRQKWLNGKLYRNFDCHYVNPVLTKDGVSNVAFYITKYILKDSDQERDLWRRIYHASGFNRNLTRVVWDVVKSRLLASKGLGLDASFETVNVPAHYETIENPIKAHERRMIAQMEDLPEDDFELFALSQDLPADDFALSARADYVKVLRGARRTRRLKVRDEVRESLRAAAMSDPERGIPIYITRNGKHQPLSQYYRQRVLDDMDECTLYLSWNPRRYPAPDYYAADAINEEVYNDIMLDWRRRRSQMDAHEVLEQRLTEICETGTDIDPFSPYRSLGKLLNISKI